MQEKFVAWDKTKRYKYRDFVSYNSYNYVYMNKVNKSTLGVPPNEGTFILSDTGKVLEDGEIPTGDSLEVRSWTLFDYFYNSGSLNTDIAAIRNINNYGPIQIAAGSSGYPNNENKSSFRYDYALYRQAFHTSQEAGGDTTLGQPVGGNFTNESNPQIYSEFEVGYSADFKAKFPDASYTIGEGTIADFDQDEGATINSFIQFKDDSKYPDLSDKSKLYVDMYVTPANFFKGNEYGYIYPWLGAYSTFNIKVKVKFTVVYSEPIILAPPFSVYIKQEHILSTSEFRDYFHTDKKGGYKKLWDAGEEGYQRAEYFVTSVNQITDFDVCQD